MKKLNDREKALQSQLANATSKEEVEKLKKKLEALKGQKDKASTSSSAKTTSRRRRYRYRYRPRRRRRRAAMRARRTPKRPNALEGLFQ
jgi:hypothetical protein